MLDKFNPNIVPGAQSEFMLTQEEFKGLMPDFWVELAVRQVLRAELEESAKFYLAVEMLENTLIVRIEQNPEYGELMRKIAKDMEKSEKIPQNKIPELMATAKFRELLKLISRTKTQEKDYEV